MSKNGLFWILVIALSLSIWSVAKKNHPEPDKFRYSDFLDGVEKHEILSVTVQGDLIEGKFKDPNKARSANDTSSPDFVVRVPKDDTLVPKLIEKGVIVDVQERSEEHTSELQSH